MANGPTPLELCSGRMYTGKLARYGERVLGFLKTDMKGKPQWRPGIWLGKTTQNDTRIIAVADGVFVTRSIRRLTSAFDVKYFTDLTRCAWECNYAALGHTMMHAKRVLAPVPVPSMIDANLAPPPMLTASVPYTPDEAAFDPPTLSLQHYLINNSCLIKVLQFKYYFCPLIKQCFLSNIFLLVV